MVLGLTTLDRKAVASRLADIGELRTPTRQETEEFLGGVWEETGLRCTLERELQDTEYRDNKGRPKVVRYWLMELAGEPAAFEPNEEVDEVRWVALEEAAVQLTYDRDRDVLASLSGFY